MKDRKYCVILVVTADAVSRFENFAKQAAAELSPDEYLSAGLTTVAGTLREEVMSTADRLETNWPDHRGSGERGIISVEGRGVEGLKRFLDLISEFGAVSVLPDYGSDFLYRKDSSESFRDLIFD